MFYERLTILCQSKGITLSAALDDLGLSAAKGTQWKQGADPSTRDMILLANYFNVSLDYLLGRSDECTNIQFNNGKKNENMTNKERTEILEKQLTLLSEVSQGICTGKYKGDLCEVSSAMVKLSEEIRNLNPIGFGRTSS